MNRLLLAPVLRYLERLRSPYLFAIAAALFAADLVTPDPVPFVDEILLGLLTLLLARQRK